MKITIKDDRFKENFVAYSNIQNPSFENDNPAGNTAQKILIHSLRISKGFLCAIKIVLWLYRIFVGSGLESVAYVKHFRKFSTSFNKKSLIFRLITSLS